MRLAWPGATVARASWIAWKMLVPRPAHARLRPVDARAIGERLVDHRLLAEHDDLVPVTALEVTHGFGHEAIGPLARREADAVGVIEQEHDVEPIHPARHRRAQQRDQQHHHQRAAHGESPSIGGDRGHAQPAGGLAPPVEQAFERQQHGGDQDEQRPQLALDRHRRRGGARRRRRRRQRMRRHVRLVAVAQVHRQLHVPARRRQCVDADLVRVGERDDAARDERFHRAPARRVHRGRRDAVRHRQEDRLARRELEARLVERPRMQPAQRVRQDQRERHPQREVRLEQVEADEDGLAIGLLERVEERPADRLHERAPGGERPHAHRVLDGDLRELHVAHHGVRAVPVHHRGILEASEHLQRHVGRDRVDEHVAARADLRRRRRVQHDDVGLAHAALILVRRLHLERDGRIGAQHLLEEEVAGTHERDGDLLGRRDHRVGDVVRRQVVVDVDPRRHRAAALVRERQHDRAADVRLERQRLLGDRLAVDGQREVERLRVRRVVHQRDERLIAVGAVVGLADREADDADVVAAPPDADPADARVRGLGGLAEGEGAVGEDVDLGARVGADERARRAQRLGQTLRQVARPRAVDGRQRAVAVAAQRRGHVRLHAGLDHHDLGALAEPPHERRRLRPRRLEARGRDVARLHRGRGIEDDDDFARALAAHGGDGPRQRERQRDEGEQLQDQQRVALQPLEEGGRLAVAQLGAPEHQARDPPLTPAHLQEVQEHERRGDSEHRERERRQKAHATIRSRSCATTNSSTGVSVLTRW